ncbi:hypothetical protein [Kribbella sp. HUAS MG21]|uniref:Uncharacterized protein n=1 Tax=Kribbella sp. HUAS MG21 TaxID=3160966 RepID=A0AAU7TA21_9ACTN
MPKDRQPDAAPDHPGMPRWVKILGVVVLALILIALLLQFVGGGDHGPGRHQGRDSTAMYGELAQVSP